MGSPPELLYMELLFRIWVGEGAKEAKGKTRGIPTIKHKRFHEEDNVHFSS